MFCSKRAIGNIFFLSFVECEHKYTATRKEENKTKSLMIEMVVDVDRLRTGDEKVAV